MPYSDFIERVLMREALLEKLTPSEPLDRELLRRVVDADQTTLAGDKAVGDPIAFSLVQGGLFYALDALDEAHKLFQEAKTDVGSYWHGMMHRREADFENARYWFRRAGTLPVFAAMHREACKHSALMARQSNWDPYLFTGQCEQARFGDHDSVKELAALQRAEFDVLFDYCWRQSGVA